MPYAHITWLQLKNRLAERLADAAKTFWVDAELGDYLAEALRTYGAVSGFWRIRMSFPTAADTAFYDLESAATTSPATNPLDFTLTDRNLIRVLQYHLLESAASQSSWGGTEMFTLDDLRYGLQRRRDQFLVDTGIVISRTTPAAPPPPTARVALTDSVIDVRRAVWQPLSGPWTNLWRSDEWELTAADRNWSVNAGIPEAYSVLGPPPLTLQLSPPPNDTGTLDLLTVSSGAALDPATAATVLGIPDDWAWAVKWGVLADLLWKEGQAFDPVRAAWCEQRYRFGIEAARLQGLVLHAQLQGVPLIPSTLYALDASEPGWQGKTTAAPGEIALAGPYLVAVRPVPDGVYSVTLDVVRPAPVPTSDSEFVQLGRETLEAVLDYGEHLAMFKCAGAEWDGTKPQADNFIRSVILGNERMRAAARYLSPAAEQSTREKRDRPRRLPVPAGV